MKYQVTAERGGDRRIWVLQCPQAPGAISQTTRLSQAPALMREAIAFVADVEEDQVEVDLVVLSLPGPVMDKVRQTKDALRNLKTVQSATAQLSRAVAADLKDAGLTGVDIGTVLGVSPQRVSQLLRGRAARAGTSATHATGAQHRGPAG